MQIPTFVIYFQGPLQNENAAIVSYNQALIL